MFWQKKQQKQSAADDTQDMAYITAVSAISYDAANIYGLSVKHGDAIYEIAMTYAGRKADWGHIKAMLSAHNLLFTQDVANAINAALLEVANYTNNRIFADMR